jgi:hypothetical protein
MMGSLPYFPEHHANLSMLELNAALEGYNLDVLKPDAVIVDVGDGDRTCIGALGHCEQDPNITLRHIIVQDVLDTIEKASTLCPQREPRVISLQSPDFFQLSL